MEMWQKSRDLEMSSLRHQLLDLQMQSDEKTVAGKLHHQIVTLEISEATALKKVEEANSKVCKCAPFPPSNPQPNQSSLLSLFDHLPFPLYYMHACKECARVCKSVQECVGVCKSMQECARVCRSVRECARVCKSVQECARVCKSVQECAKVCKSVQKCARVCKSVQECARVCRSVQEYARVCKSVQFLTGHRLIPSPLQLLLLAVQVGLFILKATISVVEDWERGYV